MNLFKITNIGFTGTQQGMSEFQKSIVENFFKAFDGTFEFHHGDCIGADAEAHDIAKYWADGIVIHPPIDESRRAFKKGNVILPQKPFLKRNQDIVDACDILIACPKTHMEELRSGTWATIRYARKNFKKIFIFA